MNHKDTEAPERIRYAVGHKNYACIDPECKASHDAEYIRSDLALVTPIDATALCTPLPCGAQSVFPAERIGCGRYITSELDLYRCVDCSTPFHRDCLRAHFGSHIAAGKCVECGHFNETDPLGRCVSTYYDASGDLAYCGCTCVFATPPAPDEADKAVAEEIGYSFQDLLGFAARVDLENRIAAALAQARKEAAGDERQRIAKAVTNLDWKSKQITHFDAVLAMIFLPDCTCLAASNRLAVEYQSHTSDCPVYVKALESASRVER